MTTQWLPARRTSTLWAAYGHFPLLLLINWIPQHFIHHSIQPNWIWYCLSMKGFEKSFPFFWLLLTFKQLLGCEAAKVLLQILWKNVIYPSLKDEGFYKSKAHLNIYHIPTLSLEGKGEYPDSSVGLKMRFFHNCWFRYRELACRNIMYDFVEYKAMDKDHNKTKVA